MDMHPVFYNGVRVGKHDDEESLEYYIDVLTRRLIEEQMKYFPNAQKLIDFWTITTSSLFCETVMEDMLPMSEISHVQLSSLFNSTEKEIAYYLK